MSAHVCTNCGTVTGSRKSPGLAALLSFLITGVGQLYNGQIVRGVALFIGAFVWGLIVFAVMAPSIILTGGGSIGLVYLLVLPVPIVAALDAYNQAGKINRGEVIP